MVNLGPQVDPNYRKKQILDLVESLLVSCLVAGAAALAKGIEPLVDQVLDQVGNQDPAAIHSTFTKFEWGSVASGIYLAVSAVLRQDLGTIFRNLMGKGTAAPADVGPAAPGQIVGQSKALAAGNVLQSGSSPVDPPAPGV